MAERGNETFRSINSYSSYDSTESHLTPRRRSSSGGSGEYRTCPRSDEGDNSGRSFTSMASTESRSESTHRREWPNRTIVEFCCGNDSLIGQPGRYTAGCKVIRCTIEHDVLTPEGERRAIRGASHPGSLVWSSIPCTGGSTWQRINLARARREGNTLLEKRVTDLQNDARRMIRVLDRVAEASREVGGCLAIEWPYGCDYWNFRATNEVIRKYDLRGVRIDGCALGLVARNGTPIVKPWFIMTNCPELLQEFYGYRCPGSTVHPIHEPCAGNETKRTESYTVRMVELIHHAFLAYSIRREANDRVAEAVSAAGREAVRAEPHVVTRNPGDHGEQFYGSAVFVCVTGNGTTSGVGNPDGQTLRSIVGRRTAWADMSDDELVDESVPLPDQFCSSVRAFPCVPAPSGMASTPDPGGTYGSSTSAEVAAEVSTSTEGGVLPIARTSASRAWSCRRKAVTNFHKYCSRRAPELGTAKVSR